MREDLQWEAHITGISIKANRMLDFLQRNLSWCPQQLRELVYFSLVRSKMEYAAIVWDPYGSISTRTLPGWRICNDEEPDLCVMTTVEQVVLLRC